MVQAQEALKAAEHELKQAEMVRLAANKALKLAQDAVKLDIEGGAAGLSIIAAETAAQAAKDADLVALEAWEDAAIRAFGRSMTSDKVGSGRWAAVSNNPKKPDMLRPDHAARLLRAPPPISPPHAAEELLHELTVHQFELEMQNDELRRAQIALEESRDSYVDLYDFAPIGYLTLSRDALITKLNLTAATLFGADRDKLTHRRFAPLVCPEYRDLWDNHLVSVLQQGKKLRCELMFKRADGSSFYAQLDCLHMQAGDVSSIRISLVDISERKLAEQKMAVSNIQLTHEVAKRTAELSALTAHIQEVAETERASLARELHDDLGSILTGLSMEVGRLRGEISDPELLYDLSIIKDLISSASRVKQNLVNQLYPTVLVDCGFVPAIDWLVKDYRKHSGIAVELVIHGEEIVMEHSFALAAYRITQECLTNIAKHACASEVHVEVKASDGLLDVTIHDNGKGMPSEISVNRHGIFGMIERARCLGGLMEIGSEEGNGTTAHLSLPLVTAKPKNKKRVLMVDDHAIVRDAIRQLLATQADDFSIEGEAADGTSAIQMAIEHEWDVMLLDISLPKKNGLNVLEAVRKVKSGLPIIMLSSHAQSEYGEIALAKGAAGYIEKVETSKLVEIMRRATLPR